MFKLTKLRKERDFNKEIGGIVNVLKGVASSEFYRLQKARKGLDEFGDCLRDFLQMANIADVRHPFLETSSLSQAVLLITSDTGFLGKLNVSVVNTALEQCSGQDELIIVGRQGARYIEERSGSSTIFPGISDEVDYEQAQTLADFIVKGFLDKKFGKTVVVYPHFLSFGVWDVRVYQLLPCRFLFREEKREPENQSVKVSESQSVRVSEDEERVIVEPSLNRIIEYLVKIWITYVLYGIFWESKLSEWSTRVMHLEGSSFKIKQTDKKLHFQYFHLLHEISDKSIREIFASRLAVRRAG